MSEDKISSEEECDDMQRGLILYDGTQLPDLVCVLAAGHEGEHTDGQATWTPYATGGVLPAGAPFVVLGENDPVRFVNAEPGDESVIATADGSEPFERFTKIAEERPQ